MREFLIMTCLAGSVSGPADDRGPTRPAQSPMRPLSASQFRETVRGFQSSRPINRAAALRAIARRMRPKRSAPFVIRGAFDGAAVVRSIAMNHLWNGDRQATAAAALIYAVNHKLGVAHTIERLAQLDHRNVYARHLAGQLIESKLAASRDPRLRLALVRAVGRLGTETQRVAVIGACAADFDKFRAYLKELEQSEQWEQAWLLRPVIGKLLPELLNVSSKLKSPTPYQLRELALRRWSRQSREISTSLAASMGVAANQQVEPSTIMLALLRRARKPRDVKLIVPLLGSMRVRGRTVGLVLAHVLQHAEDDALALAAIDAILAIETSPSPTRRALMRLRNDVRYRLMVQRLHQLITEQRKIVEMTRKTRNELILQP